MNSQPKEVRVQTDDTDDAPEKKPFVEPELERHDTLPEVTGDPSFNFGDVL
jgi:hypothetical protein